MRVRLVRGLKILKVKNYQKDYQKVWDNFVMSSNNGTIFHLQKFLNYHPKNRFNWHHLIFEERDNVIALLPAQLKGDKLISPAGASFGGFVTQDISYDSIDEIVIALLKYCKQERIREIYLTPPPLVYSKSMTMNIDYALLYHGFQYEKHLYSSIVNLKKIKNLRDLEKRARNAIRKAVKSGVKVVIGDDYESFYPILAENKRKFNLPPTHTLDELKKIKQLLPDMPKLFLVYKDGNLIGGSLIFICNMKTLMSFYIALNYEYQQFRPINKVLYEIMRWGYENNYEFFDIGVNQDTASKNPMDLNRTLVSFKASMGARCFFRSTFHNNIR